MKESEERVDEDHEPTAEVRNLDFEGRENRVGRTRAQTIEIKNADECISFCLLSTIGKKENDPKTFDEAWYHPTKSEEWQVAIKKEFYDMNIREVWKKVSRDEAGDKKTIGMKWVFKTKTSGRCRARLVALGYGQIPGTDFTEIHAPMINDMTLRILLVMVILNKWSMCLIDIEAAFLEGDLDEDIYVELPEGLNKIGKNKGQSNW